MSEKEGELKKAYFYALKSTNMRPCSREGLKGKLKERGFSEDIIEEVIADFTKKGLLDDAKFSRLWLQSRMASNPKGEIVLRQELRSKGVDEEAIETALKDAKGEYNEYEVVKALAISRMASLKDLGAVARKRRLFGYLRRRGFAVETIMRVINEIRADKDN